MIRPRTRFAGRGTGSWLVMAMAGLTCGCSSSGTRAPQLEQALAPTFANLIRTQGSLLGLPPVDVAALRASASCHRVGPGTNGQGAGDWACTIQWSPPGYRGTWHDNFDVSLTTDGCYTATADGEDGHLGGPRITRRDGTTVANLVYVFDGCFDTT